MLEFIMKELLKCFFLNRIDKRLMKEIMFDISGLIFLRL